MDRGSLDIQSIPEALRCTWIPPGGGGISRVRSVHGDDVDAIANALSTAPSTLADLETLGRRIFSRLLDREVRQAVFDTPRCHLALTSNLPAIPWELACSDGRFLADVHAVGMGPEAEPAPTSGNLNILLIADPTGDLPWSVGEANEIADRLRHVSRANICILSGASATRNNVLSAIEDSPFHIVHFSCHAEYDGSTPGGSHVRLFDGPLTAEELYQTDSAQPPALCVLNACESGREGVGGRIAGLASSLRMAGARAVIGARWPVNNKCSAFWMSAFYAALLSGESLGEAVGQARTETRRLFANDPLLTWSAFALTGAPWQRLVDDSVQVRIGRAPLVGREAQWKLLMDAWGDARAGRGSVVVLVGPAGSGKTRLIDDLVSFLPQAAVVPWEQFRVSDSQAFLHRAQTSGGLVIVLDDFDQLTPSDQGLVESLSRSISREPVLIVIAVPSPQHISVPKASVRVAALHPLAGADLSLLIQSLGGERPDGLHSAYPGEAERIALGLPRGETAGALANSLPETERAVLRAAAVWGDSFTVDDIAGILDLQPQTLWLPLERLTSNAWIIEQSRGSFRFRDAGDRPEILDAIRPIGARVGLERIAARLCEDHDRRGEAGQHWLAAGDGEAAIAAFRAAFEKGTDPRGTVRWHSALLEAGGTQSDPERVAAAFSELGDWLSAREWWERSVNGGGSNRGTALIRLAEACLHTGDAETAERLLREAEATAPREQVLVGRAEVLVQLGRPEEALLIATEALEVAEGSPVGSQAALAGANASLMLAQPTDAITVCQTALQWPASARVRSALSRAIALAWQYAGDYAAAESELLRLADTQGEKGPSAERAATLLALAHLCRDQGRLDESLAALEESQALAERQGRMSVSAEARNVRSSVYRRLGRYDDAMDEAESALKTSLAAGLVPEAIRSRIHIATALTETGSLTAARESALEAAREAVAATYDFGLAWAKNVLGMAALEAGNRDSARTAFNESLDISRAIHSHIGVASGLCNLAWAAWPHASEAGDLFQQAIVGADRIAYRAVLLPARFGLALCQGREHESEEPLQGIEALNMGGIVPWLRSKRGEWNLLSGRTEAAIKDLAPAYRVARRSGMRALQARCALALAIAYDTLGDPAADALREEGESLNRQCLEDW